MAAYCRVSTDQEEQLLSYENQVNYYTNYISENPLYEYAGTYADEGVSGTNTKKRDEFNRMIADCRAGKIDMIITKSISRFARNTLDCLNYVRELKDLGIGIIFEKENIKSKMLLQVHDELIFNVYNDEIDKVKDIVYNTMTKVFELKVPLDVDIELGNNWYEAK